MGYFSDYAMLLLKAGYQPIPDRGKIPVLENWQTLPINEDVINHWIQVGYGRYNIGIRHQTAVDIDVRHEALAMLTEDKIRELVGVPINIRYGDDPKGLVPIRSDVDRKMVTAIFEIPNTDIKCQIEILAKGQQWVFAGIHPGTGRDYRWTRDEGATPFFKTPPTELPELNADKIEILFDWFDETATRLGLVKVKERPSGQRPGAQFTQEQAEQAAHSQPRHMTPVDDFNRNGVDQFVEMLLEKGWREAGSGFHMKMGPDGVMVNTPVRRFTRPGKEEGVSAGLYKSPLTGIWQLEVFTSSLLELEAGKHYIAHVWAKYQHHGDYSRSAADFRRMGMRGDERTAEEEFADLESADILAKFLERFVMVTEGPCVIDTKMPADKAVMTLREFLSTYNNIAPRRPGQQRNATRAWLDHPSRITVRDVVYAPGRDRIYFDERGVTHFNRFAMPEWLPTVEEERVKVPLEHLEYLLGDGMPYYLGWMSHVVSRAGDRPMVTPLLISTYHGTGRGWVDELMKKLVGVWNCSSTTINEMAGLGNQGQFNEYMVDTIFCSVPEAKGHGKQQWEIDDAIRDKLTSTHSTINRKYGAKGYSAIYTAFHFSTNHRLPFRLDPVDRRVYAKECLHKPKEPEYYDRLYAWLEDPENLRQFFWWLHRYNAQSNWNPKAPAPMTREKLTMCSVNADNDMETAVITLMMDPDLPSVGDMKSIKKMACGVLEYAFGSNEALLTHTGEAQLIAILNKKCIRANNGEKVRNDESRPRVFYILRDYEKWINASIPELQTEQARWKQFDPKVHYNTFDTHSEGGK